MVLLGPIGKIGNIWNLGKIGDIWKIWKLGIWEIEKEKIGKQRMNLGNKDNREYMKQRKIKNIGGKEEFGKTGTFGILWTMRKLGNEWQI